VASALTGDVAHKVFPPSLPLRSEVAILVAPQVVCVTGMVEALHDIYNGVDEHSAVHIAKRDSISRSDSRIPPIIEDLGRGLRGAAPVPRRGSWQPFPAGARVPVPPSLLGRGAGARHHPPIIPPCPSLRRIRSLRRGAAPRAGVLCPPGCALQGEDAAPASKRTGSGESGQPVASEPAGRGAQSPSRCDGPTDRRSGSRAVRRSGGGVMGGVWPVCVEQSLLPSPQRIQTARIPE
jgi:hypothetical protein